MIVSTVVTVSDAPVTFATVGLKSKQSLKSNCPVGSGSSGSILVARSMLVYHHSSFGLHVENMNSLKSN